MSRPLARVCLVTTGHPSTNPRLVKEADALVGAGYDVRVVAAKFVEWANRADAEFEGRPWTVEWVRFGEMASRWSDTGMRARRRLARRLVGLVGFRQALAERALHYVVPELTQRASRKPADLFIAHNLAALPAAAAAAHQYGAKLGFDAEDFHRGEIPDMEAHSLTARLVRWTEERYIPTCDYVTAASKGIAEAYAQALGMPEPVTIDNVFPLEDRDAPVSEADLAMEKAPGTRTLYWFSQTIGAGRGLEDVLEALSVLDDDVHLALRGRWADGFEASFMGRAKALGVGYRVRVLPPVPPGELVVRTARHDVGLALEPGSTLNNTLASSNKIFTYLLAGIPAVATETVGQRRVCEQAPHATRIVPPGDPRALADAVRSLLGDRGARGAAARVAEERFNWNVEKGRFLDLVDSALRTRRET